MRSLTFQLALAILFFFGVFRETAALPDASQKFTQLRTFNGKQPFRKRSKFYAPALRRSESPQTNETESQALYPGRRAPGARFTFYVTGL